MCAKVGSLAVVVLRLLVVGRAYRLQLHSTRVNISVMYLLHNDVAARIEEGIRQVHRKIAARRQLLYVQRRVVGCVHIVAREGHSVLVGRHTVAVRRILETELEVGPRLRLHVGGHNEAEVGDGTGPVARRSQQRRVKHPLAPCVGKVTQREVLFLAGAYKDLRRACGQKFFTTHTIVLYPRVGRCRICGLVVVDRTILHHTAETHHRVVSAERYARTIARPGHVVRPPRAAKRHHRHPHLGGIAANRVEQVHRVVVDALRHIGARIQHDAGATAARVLDAVGIESHLHLRRNHLVLACTHTHIVYPPALVGRHVAAQRPLLKHKAEYQFALLDRHRRRQYVVDVETLALPLAVVNSSFAPHRVRVLVEGTRVAELRTEAVAVLVVLCAAKLTIGIVCLVGQLHIHLAYLHIVTAIGLEVTDMVELKRHIVQQHARLREINRVCHKHHVDGLRLQKSDGACPTNIQVGGILVARRGINVVGHRLAIFEALVVHHIHLSLGSKAQKRKNSTEDKKPGFHIVLVLFIINQLFTHIIPAKRALCGHTFCRYKFTSFFLHVAFYYTKNL